MFQDKWDKKNGWDQDLEKHDLLSKGTDKKKNQNNIDPSQRINVLFYFYW